MTQEKISLIVTPALLAFLFLLLVLLLSDLLPTPESGDFAKQLQGRQLHTVVVIVIAALLCMCGQVVALVSHSIFEAAEMVVWAFASLLVFVGLNIPALIALAPLPAMHGWARLTHIAFLVVDFVWLVTFLAREVLRRRTKSNAWERAIESIGDSHD